MVIPIEISNFLANALVGTVASIVVYLVALLFFGLYSVEKEKEAMDYFFLMACIIFSVLATYILLTSWHVLEVIIKN